MLDNRGLKEIYSNEQVFIILLARLQLGTCHLSAVTDHLQDAPVNWQLVFKLAQVHSIRAFLYSAITTHGIEVPAQFLASLKKRYQATKLRNFEQIKACTELVGKFAEQGITLIPYKGALFAEGYYADWAARESTDLDFLVDTVNVATIEDWLINNHYKGITTVPRPFLGYYKEFFKDIVYHKPGTPSAVELHWRLLDKFSGQYPAYRFFSAGLVPYRTGSFAIQKLAPTYDFLAVASNHFVKDMSIKFKYLIDMACLIQKEAASLDTKLILSTAKSYGFRKRLDIGLHLVNDILGINFTTDSKIYLSKDELVAPLSVQLPLSRFYINELPFIKRSLQLQDSAWQKVKFMLRCMCYVFLPTYADINAAQLPVYLLPVLAVLRPFRLIYQAIRH
ncbi:nucleotidyltransferase family protein [Mucilaginibacter sp. Bleaf8]|uniref:nucleotidyltransferase domain-containing protein n=1 Tax=Mucilaginibacter sp. Bleaf8 TaxID=2834430 RepID=UPI001BCDBE1C|nr:nucleotidyltransferase family protein [Mucilaginibacter sp. Bleaf8]MBS7563851.1 nucleotidyltransferase family protein [Mucilaginibacter sp. Bleaf8]